MPPHGERLAAALLARHDGAVVVGTSPGAILVALPRVRTRTVLILDLDHAGDGPDDARRELDERIRQAVASAPPGAAMHFVAVNQKGVPITDILRAHFWPLAFQSWQQMFAGKPFTPNSQRYYSSWEWRPGTPIQRVRGERLPVLVAAAAAANTDATAAPTPGVAVPAADRAARRQAMLWTAVGLSVLTLAPMVVGGALARSRRTGPDAAARRPVLPQLDTPPANGPTRAAQWQVTRTALAGTPVSVEVPSGYAMHHDPSEPLRRWQWGRIASDGFEICVFVPPCEPGDFPPGTVALDELVTQFAAQSEPGMVRVVPPERSSLPSGRQGVRSILRPIDTSDARRIWSWWLVEGDQAVWVWGNIREDLAEQFESQFLRIVDSVHIDSPRGR